MRLVTANGRGNSDDVKPGEPEKKQPINEPYDEMERRNRQFPDTFEPRRGSKILFSGNPDSRCKQGARNHEYHRESAPVQGVIQKDNIL